MLSAPAGYGKTMLVHSWTTTVGPAATLSLTTMRQFEAESGAVFWINAIEGLRQAGIDTSAVPAPAASEGWDRPLLTGLMRSLNNHARPVVWVLDCDEFALSPEVGDGLHSLLEGCPEALRLVLLTRADPPLPLHRYRLAGSMTEIRASDLVFTATEASALLQRAGLDVAPADALTLRTRTGGWPAGLRFAAMALAGRVDVAQAIREFRGDSGNVAAYLMNEVYAKQPAQIQDFLLRTCIVDELSPGLASVLTGPASGAAALQFVAHGNSFVEPVPGKPGRYRYQSLFREFLRSQLSFEHPELKPRLHCAAAEWLAEHGQTLSAIQHAVAAEAWPMATRFLVDGLWVGNVLVGRRRTLLRKLFARIPRDAEGAESAVTRAALALAEQDWAGCDAELATVRGSLGGEGSVRPSTSELALVILEAVSATLGVDLDAALERVLAAEDALRCAAPEVRDLHPELVVLLARSKATVLVERGDLGPALDALDEGIRAARSAPLGGALGDALGDLQGVAALVHALRGDLRQSERMVTRLVPGVTETSGAIAGAPRTALAALAWVRMDEYDLPAAQALARSVGEGVPPYDARVLDGILALLQARLLAAQGRSGLACAALHAARRRTADAGGQAWLDRALVLGEVNLLLGQERHGEALAVARSTKEPEELECHLAVQRAVLASGEPARAPAESHLRALEHSRLEVQVDTWLFLAELAVTQGDEAGAEASLEKALRLAAPERLRRPFLEATGDVRSLLDRQSLSARTRWLGASAIPSVEQVSSTGRSEEAHPVGGHGAARPGEMVNPLTKKELEVLGHLAELLTTEEIAETMFVSVNTVRSHVRNILRKLAVARRNEAVRRAWELHLLPPSSVA